MLDCTGPLAGVARQSSIDRFVKRFTRDLEDPEEIGEKHIALRRLLLKKQKSISLILRAWRQAAADIAMDE